MQLVDLPRMPRRPRVRNLKKPIWTENKARLIERYVYYFLQVAKNCTYIDGFAGPQEEEHGSENWAAKRVIELRPRWIRKFYLFDESAEQIARLNALIAEQPARTSKEPKRSIECQVGDANVEIPRLLQRRSINERDATFCLLDQRTFECHWSTVEAIARYKQEGLKIEIFYFFPIGWLDRSLSALKNDAVGSAWWGRSDWRDLRNLGSVARGELVAKRFSDELGYSYAFPWPIYERRGGGRIMYFMVHASDHPEAPKLMWRAYHKAVEPLEPIEQLELAGI